MKLETWYQTRSYMFGARVLIDHFLIDVGNQVVTCKICTYISTGVVLFRVIRAERGHIYRGAHIAGVDKMVDHFLIKYMRTSE